MDEKMNWVRESERAALEARLSAKQRALYLPICRKQEAEMKRQEQRLSQRRRAVDAALQKQGLAATPETFVPDQDTPRPLRDAAREYAAQVRQFNRTQKAHDRERTSFLQQAVASTLEAIKASANPAREASLRRIAEQRAVLEARLPEQYRAQYLAYAEKLDTQMQRQEKRLAQRWETYEAEQRKIGASSPTHDLYPLEVHAPRTLRIAALEYVEQLKRVDQLTALIENQRIGFLTRAIAGDPDPTTPPSETVLREIVPSMLAIANEISQFASSADETSTASERRERMQERLAQARQAPSSPSRGEPGLE